MSAEVPPAAPVAAPAPEDRSRPLAWGALLLLALALGDGNAVKTVLSPVQEAAQHDLRLSDLQISLVQGLATSLPIALVSIPLGRLADRRSRVRILVAAAAAWTLGAALTAAAGGFASLFAARLLAGLGGGVAIPAAISVAADLSPPERRGRALILLSVGNAAGAAVAFAAGGVLFGLLGRPGGAFAGLAPWRGVQAVFALASAAAAALLLLIREPERQERGATGSDDPLSVTLRRLWRRRGLLAPLLMGQLGVVMCDTAAGVWAAPLLIRTHHLRPEQFAGWLGAVVLAAGVLGAIAGGLLADLGQRLRLPGGVLFGAVAASLVAAPASLFALAPDVATLGTVLCVLLVCGVTAGTITSTALAVLVPNELRGVCMGGFMVLTAVVGGLAPTVVPLLGSAMGGGGGLGPALAATDLTVGVVSALGFLLAARRARA